jgi:hypothetical protein
LKLFVEPEDVPDIDGDDDPPDLEDRDDDSRNGSEASALNKRAKCK